MIADGDAGSPPQVKLADFGVSVVAREDQAKAPGSQHISPLVALLTGEADAQEASLSELSIEEQNASSELSAPGASADAPSEPPRTDDLTEAGMIVGTPMYMAPEISFGSRHAQPPSDVFALGVIAYELLTKELPFQRPPVGTMLRLETLRIPMGLRGRSDVSPALLALLERSLSMDPAQRPTAAELATALVAEPTILLVASADK